MLQFFFFLGLSKKATIEILSVSTPTVMNLLQFVYKEIVVMIDISETTCIEMDEMHHTLGNKKNKLLIWKIIDHHSHKLIGWAFGGRDTQTLKKMYNSMNFDEYLYVYSDHYKSYSEFFPAEKLTQSKSFKNAIERNNGRQRHGLVVVEGD